MKFTISKKSNIVYSDYKAVVTYSFADDDLRNDFEDFLISKGLKNEPDQSTYALPYRGLVGPAALENAISKYLEDVDMEANDHVTLYRLAKYTDGNYGIRSRRWSAVK